MNGKKRWAVALTACSLAGAASALGGETPAYLLGSATAASESERRIEIGPDTRWVNVKQGETVLFGVGAQNFAWRFDGPPRSFDLTRVAPAGVLGRSVMVYVMPKHDPRRQ